MEDKIGNNTHNNSGLQDWVPVPLSQCIPWLIVFITEFLAIVTVNIITIIVFVKQRQLQRRSTYLIIHLAIVDLLVGAFSGPLRIEFYMAFRCNLWKVNYAQRVIEVKETLVYIPMASLLNLAAISLERAHAAFCPLRHRNTKRRVYGVIISCIWFLYTGLLVTGKILGCLSLHKIHFSYYVTAVFVILLSYLCIFLKVRCTRHPQHRSAAVQRERKLTYTLFSVTLGSLLTWLPIVIFQGLFSFNYDVLVQVVGEVGFHVDSTAYIICFANSLINPIIYAMRMPELRAGVSQLFRLNRNRLHPVDLPLRNVFHRGH